MITVEDFKDVVKDLMRKKENVEKFIDARGSTISHTTRSMLLSDADLFKRYAEMAADITEEDLKDQVRMGEFLEFKDKAVNATLYNEKIKPIEGELL